MKLLVYSQETGSIAVNRASNRKGLSETLYFGFGILSGTTPYAGASKLAPLNNATNPCDMAFFDGNDTQTSGGYLPQGLYSPEGRD